MARPPKLKRSSGSKPPPLPVKRAPMTSVQTGPRRAWTESGPDIDVEYGPVGRETMAAITEELASDTDALLPESEPPPAEQDATGTEHLGRDTMTALAGELLRDRAEPSPQARRRRRTRGYEEEAGAGPAQLEAFEMLTFVVRGPDIGRLSSQTARREFVAERLLTRLPSGSLDEVERIDVTPWTDKGTVVIRVWCKVL